MKKIVMIIVLFILAGMIYAGDYEGNLGTITRFRIATTGIWIQFERTPSKLNGSGYYRMHGYISSSLSYYKEMVAQVMLAHALKSEIKYIWFNYDTTELGEILKIHTIEIE
jgi:hypothetical protein